MSLHQGYLHLHKADCSSFRNFEEFCREPEPFGLGYDIEILNRIVEERLERQRAERLENVPEDGRLSRDRETATGRFLESHHSGHGVPNGESDNSKAHKRIRAIKRAPPIVGYLYENNLLGENEAARLGVLNPLPERVRQINEIVTELKELQLPSDAVQKRVFKCQANALVNKKLETWLKYDPVGE